MFFQVFCLLMGKHLRLAVFASYNKLSCQNEETAIERQVAGLEVMLPFVGVANGTTKNVGLRKFWQDLEISEACLISLEVSFLHGLFLLFLSLETFYQRVSGSDF